MKTGRLLQMSGVVVDLIYRVASVPAAGAEARVSSFTMSAGGGFNAMLAAKRMGMDVAYGGVLGTGPFATIAESALEQAGISILGYRSPDADQGSCVVLIDDNAERTFVAKEGAEGNVQPGHLAALPPPEFEWALLSGYALVYRASRDAVSAWARRTSHLLKFVFDACPLIGEIPPKILDQVLGGATWISANREEAAAITGQQDPRRAVLALAVDRPADGGALVRDGANGCYVASSKANECRHVPGFSVEVVDTNGAGDTHVGAFVAALSRAESPVQAALLANAAAALSATTSGPATCPELRDVEAFSRKHQPTLATRNRSATTTQKC